MKILLITALNNVFEKVSGGNEEFSPENLKIIKGKKSSKVLATELGINEPMLNEFEICASDFFKFKDDIKKSRIVSFRLALWLETICKNLDISFSIDEQISNEELAIKQVRALELIIRDIVNDNMGGKQSVLLKLRELFNQQVVDNWLKNADETGVLSGTTFSELSSIFLDKNIFKGYQDLFDDSLIKLSSDLRSSLRMILEDIRRIRNAIAHNKKVSKVQIEALNEYYRTIAGLIKDAKNSRINPDSYLDLDKTNMEGFISNLKEDNKVISTKIEEINTDVKEVRKHTSKINKRTILILGGIILLIGITGSILYSVSKQSGSTSDISKDLKDVKEIVTGDAELKNMSSSDDLTVSKELNERTKDKNAKRLAIIYFENSGEDRSMNALKKGLADMMITDLSNIQMLDIVERDRLEEILKEQKLNNSSQFDAGTASKVGRLLGAQVILTGSYFEMFGSIRVDARFIDVETGQILKSDGVEGASSSFFKLQKQLSWKIIKNLDAKITDEEKTEIANIEKSKALTFEDLKEYSKALDLFDDGNKQASLKIAKIIQEKYPDFSPVNNLIKKLNTSES